MPKVLQNVTISQFTLSQRVEAIHWIDASRCADTLSKRLYCLILLLTSCRGFRFLIPLAEQLLQLVCLLNFKLNFKLVCFRNS